MERRAHGARMMGMKGRRYKLWWFRKGDGVDGVGGAVLIGGGGKKGK